MNKEEFFKVWECNLIVLVKDIGNDSDIQNKAWQLMESLDEQRRQDFMVFLEKLDEFTFETNIPGVAFDFKRYK